MKVAISFIGTNKYLDYLPKYYENIEKYFLPNSEKTILVFTDGELNDTPDNVKVYYQEHLPWPYITLKRFEIINKAREEILKNDYFVFIDADALVVDEIPDPSFFFRCCGQNLEQVPLFGVQHPCHYLQMPPHNQYPGAWDQTPGSEACVDFNDEENPIDPDIKKQFYCQGCLWGGTVPAVLHMIDELEARVNRDLEKGIIAQWHDESHINKYFLERPFDVHIMAPAYAYPEVFDDQAKDIIRSKKIVHLAKDNSQYQQ